MTQEQQAMERLKPLLRRLSMETKTYKKNYLTIQEQTIKALEVYRA